MIRQVYKYSSMPAQRVNTCSTGVFPYRCRAAQAPASAGFPSTVQSARTTPSYATNTSASADMSLRTMAPGAQGEVMQLSKSVRVPPGEPNTAAQQAGRCQALNFKYQSCRSQVNYGGMGRIS